MSNEPYPGLNPYSEKKEDAKRFFGRKTQIENIIDRLMASRLTILYGESGVGKTSVVRAGVAAQLRQQAQENLINYEVPVHAVVVFPPFDLSWKDEPLPQLKQQIEQDIRELVPNIQPPEPELPFIKTLQAWTELLGGEEGDGELFIILDQFEEYFLYHHSSEPEEGTFAFEFPRAVTRSRLRVNFLLSMRKDSLAELDYFKGRLLNLLSNTLELGHLDWNSAKEAIKRPIDQYYNKEVSPEEAFDIEEQLIEQVLEEVSRRNNHNGRIEAPYLQLVMESLWKKEKDTGSRRLRLQTLTELRGAAGIAERHLNEKMELLSKNERDLEIAANVFHYLVTPSGGKQAYSAFDLAELANREQRKGDRIELVTKNELDLWLDKLTQTEFRLLRPVGKSPHLSYEIFHDVLAKPILAWLAGYVKKKANRAAMRRIVIGTVIGAVFAIGIPAAVVILVSEVTGKIGILQRASERVENAGKDFESGDSEQFNALLTAMKAMKIIAMKEVQPLPDLLPDLLNDPSLKIYFWFDPRTEQTISEPIIDGLQKILKNIREKNQIQVLGGRVWSVSFGPDGKTLATASADGIVRLWDLQGKPQQQPQQFPGHKGAVLSVSFSPDEKTLATASADGTVRLWDLQSKQPLQIFEDPQQKGSVYSVSFSPNGKTLATGSNDGIVRLWNLQGKPQQQPQRFSGHKGAVLSVSFSPNGKTLARVMQISQIAQKFFTQFLCRYFKPSREFFVGRT
jgi:hypothetical protein